MIVEKTNRGEFGVILFGASVQASCTMNGLLAEASPRLSLTAFCEGNYFSTLI